MENSRYLRPYRTEEFQEEDVWALIKEDGKPRPKIGGPNCHSSTPLSISRPLPSASRMIPRTHTHQKLDESKLVQSSAPVKIPDWSKIYGESPVKIHHDDDHDDDGDDDDGDGGGDDDDDDDDGRLPPHEWLAKKNSKNKISSFSVCEGLGRTLKGRDLSRVRNAVLSKTGFL